MEPVPVERIRRRAPGNIVVIAVVTPVVIMPIVIMVVRV
jgi:hypothetical protein